MRSCTWRIIVRDPIKMPVSIPASAKNRYPSEDTIIGLCRPVQPDPAGLTFSECAGHQIFIGEHSNVPVIIMADTMEEKRKKIARKALEQAMDTGDRQTVNAQRKANKELTGYEGDE
jgi:hypothetical protein